MLSDWEKDSLLSGDDALSDFTGFHNQPNNGPNAHKVRGLESIYL